MTADDILMKATRGKINHKKYKQMMVKHWLYKARFTPNYLIQGSLDPQYIQWSNYA